MKGGIASRTMLVGAEPENGFESGLWVENAGHHALA
jgi:hypothetical protein